jgi:hypothetical protein
MFTWTSWTMRSSETLLVAFIPIGCSHISSAELDLKLSWLRFMNICSAYRINRAQAIMRSWWD